MSTANDVLRREAEWKAHLEICDCQIYRGESRELTPEAQVYYMEQCAAASELAEEVDGLRRMLAAEHGRPEGAPSQGWTRTTAGWRKGRLRVRRQGWGWGWVLLGAPGTVPLDAGVADTAREAMRAADASLTTAKDIP